MCARNAKAQTGTVQNEQVAGTAKARRKETSSEVDAYVFIKENLKALGWDTRNPARVPEGQVFTQNECLADDEIKACLGMDRPENIVKVTEKILWIIEAKRTQRELDLALADALRRVEQINASAQYQVRFISGVAGNALDGFLVRTHFLREKKFRPITWNGIEVTGLLSPKDIAQVLAANTESVEDPVIDEKLFIARANRINTILHLGAVNPHQRAGVMAALLLSMLSDTGPNVEERAPAVLIGDINSRVQSILRNQGKVEFYDYIKISLPATPDNHVKFRQALVGTIQELNNLNIKSAMNSGADWLGAFYEVFLKYASWAQDLGIVLTPRHLTRWAADVIDVEVHDIVYDLTCGTGGFLVAAFDHVKRKSNEQQLTKFKQNCLFGVEEQSGVAALAVVNMIFRGDGKNNIKEGNCFAQYLARYSKNGTVTAKFVDAQASDPPVTKVMMNPPFALKRGAEKEYKFVDRALAQMEDGGILFAVLPYSAMCKPKGYDTWRKRTLLPHHTLLAVVTFPFDIFYPIGVTTCGVFIRKGVPHPQNQKVLWVRALGDGLLKSKGRRLPNERATDELHSVAALMRAFVHNTSHPIPNAQQLQKASAIDSEDKQAELVPEAYLDQAEPSTTEIFNILENDLRELLAYLVKIKKAKLEADLLDETRNSVPSFATPKWKMLKVTDLFELRRGSFHSIARLDPGGPYPTISRVSTDNGCVGFYERPGEATVWPAKIITVSSVTGDAFVQPVQFIATDNVVMCVLKKDFRNLRLSSVFFIQAMMNHIKWRYSYGRQCYKTKYAKTEIPVPIKESGELDEDFMASMVGQANHWKMVEASFETADTDTTSDTNGQS